MSNKLGYTLEEINYKLDLIDKNKNLLPYPYEIILPDGFEDVGDGSILTYVPSGATEESFLLTTCNLPAKKFIVSLSVTNILEESVADSGFSLEIPDYTIINNLLDLSAKTEETSIAVYLKAPTDFSAGLLIKPQIEEVQVINGKEVFEKTAWAPNMDKIGTYVDRRFNGATAKIKLLSDEVTEIKNNSSGGISDAFIADTEPPENTKLLWIDTSTDANGTPTGGLKYHNGTDWVTVPVRFS